MHWHWHLLSALGDVTRMLPVLGCAVVLLARQSAAGRAAARRWLTAVGGAGVLVAASKIAFYGWGTGVKAWNLAMPSGHATLALALWPPLLTVLVPVERCLWRRGAMASGISLGLACAWSRVALHAHPLPEAIAGSAVGLMAMMASLPPLKTLQLTIPRAVIAGAGLLVLLLWSMPYSLRVPTEAWFARSGARLAGRPAPVARKDWQHASPQCPGKLPRRDGQGP